MLATQKVHNHLFGDPVVNECNRMLRSCKTKEERMRVAPLIRSMLKFDNFSELILEQGLAEAII